MVRIRTIVSVLMVGVLALGSGVLFFASQVWWDLPAPQGRLVRGPHELVGVHSGRAYAWVVPTDDPQGVVLVDSGSDRAAARIFTELRKGGREVRAILLTHAHGPQIAGLEAFPDVPVYVGEADRPLLAGEAEPGGWLARFTDVSVELPSDLRTVGPDETVTVDGATFVAVPTPGHTPGSVTWWWRDVVFTGGALLAVTPPAVSPSGLNDDDELATKSVERLLPLDFDAIADARTGIVTTARPQVHWMLGVDLAPPTRTLAAGEPEGPLVVQREGTYVEAWIAGPDGHRPGLVVDERGVATVVADPARPADRAFLGRRVVASGAPVDGALAIASDQITDSTLALADDETPSDGRLPLVTSREQLPELTHQWIVAEGTLVELQPWTAIARFGEGRLQLSDGVIDVTAPAGLPVDEPVALLGRVGLGHDGVELAIVSVCPSASRCRETPAIRGE